MIKKIILATLRILATVFLLSLIVLAAIGGYAAGTMLKVMDDTNPIDASSILDSLNENSKIVDSSGNLIEKIETVEYREIVPYEKIPKNLIKAFVAIEDRRFFDHNGVDIIGIGKSFLDNVEAGDSVRGGSTITQQLARNIYLSNEKSLVRKLKEVFIARQIENSLSKEEIFEAYLNRVFLGQNSYGVQAAAQTYFSKNVWELSLAECATLAGIVKGPSIYALYFAVLPQEVGDSRVLGDITLNNEPYKAIYNPRPHERAKQVLNVMYNNGKGNISKEEYRKALAEDVASQIKPTQKRVSNLSNYYTDYVKKQAVEVLMDELNLNKDDATSMLFRGGLTITASIDIQMQRNIENLLSKFTQTLIGDTSNYDYPPLINWSRDGDKNILDANGDLIYYRDYNLLDKNNNIVLNPDQFKLNKDGSLTIRTRKMQAYDGYIDVFNYYNYDENMNLVTHKTGNIVIGKEYLKKEKNSRNFTLSGKFLKQNPNFYKKSGDNLLISREFFDPDITGTKQPQTSVVIIDQATGELKAIVGGRSEKGRWVMNRADMPRQPGSSMKPLAEYIGLLDNGKSAASPVDDVPSLMIDGKPWPKNVYRGYDGILSIRQALIQSSNGAAVKAMSELSISKSKDYLKKLGIIDEEHPNRDSYVEKSENASTNDEVLSTALGGMTYGVTNIRMAGAYATFANYGVYKRPTAISKIVNNKGEVLYKHDNEGKRVLSKTVSYQMVDILTSVIEDNTTTAKIDGFQTFGKTGTTDDKQDLWFLGANPYYTTGVWIGVDNMSIKLDASSKTAALLAKNVNNLILKNKKPKKFVEPEGIKHIEVCSKSGMLPSEASKQAGDVVVEIFDKSNMPTEKCNVHVYRTVDIRNGLLATDFTPSFLKKNKVFYIRPSDYDPSKFNNTYPDDWSSSIPTRYSNLKGASEEKYTTEDGAEAVKKYKNDGSYVITKIYKDGKKVVENYDAKGKKISETITLPPDKLKPQDELNKKPKENQGDKNQTKPNEDSGENKNKKPESNKNPNR